MNAPGSRRRFLRSGSLILSSGLSGCVGESIIRGDSEPNTTERGNGEVGTSEESVIYVDPNGSDDHFGNQNSPVESIQEAVNRAGPGDKVQLTPGIHTAGSPGMVCRTERAGEPGNPITITGPSDAVVRGPHGDESLGPLFSIRHSHIHLRGMYLDGLTKPDEIKNHQAYRPFLVNTTPPHWQESHPKYLTDVKIKPNFVANTRHMMIISERTNKLEIGEFEVVGPTGTGFLFGDDEGHHGEVLNLGTVNVTGESYPWETPDESHDIHVHHIVNREGHPHAELVQGDPGIYNMLIEYCSTLGNSGRYRLNEDQPPSSEAGMTIRGAKTTLRWCVVEDGHGTGVHLNDSGLPTVRGQEYFDMFENVPDARFPGNNNAVYGNRLVDNESYAIYDVPWADSREPFPVRICGNEYNGDSHYDPDQACSGGIPQTDEIGYRGGESPWN